MKPHQSKKQTRNTKKDTVIKRMVRGFKVMGKKIKESDYVKGIQEEQKTANPDAMLDVSLQGFSEEFEPKKKRPRIKAKKI
jgi:hypothetical protein